MYQGSNLTTRQLDNWGGSYSTLSQLSSAKIEMLFINPGKSDFGNKGSSYKNLAKSQTDFFRTTPKQVISWINSVKLKTNLFLILFCTTVFSCIVSHMLLYLKPTNGIYQKVQPLKSSTIPWLNFLIMGCIRRFNL